VCGEICGYSVGKTSQMESSSVKGLAGLKSNKKAGFAHPKGLTIPALMGATIQRSTD
jgi:hypothetical protein